MHLGCMGNGRTNELQVDVAVIGAGTAGLAAYRAAAAVTPRVILIEAGAYGTTCARVGCMPSKLLIAAAEAAHHATHASPFGVHATVRVDGREVMDRVRRERDRFVGFVLDGVHAIPSEHKLVGRARFVSPRELTVVGADGEATLVRARSVVIATGSSPFIPPIFGELGDRLIVNDDVFQWETLPSSVAVFGAGVIGLELSQALSRLGVRVRIFGKSGTVGPLTDPEVRASALAAFREEFPIHPDAKVRRVGRSEDGAVLVEYEDDEGALQRESFDYALVAAGRRPNVRGIGLENAGVPLDARGIPNYDRTTLQVADSSIFIAGDASDDVPLLHEAADEGRIAGGNAAAYPTVTPGHRRSLLGVVFTEPQIAVVGSTRANLDKLAPNARAMVTGSVSFADQGRSRVMLQNRGMTHVYADAETGRFLGAELVGPRVEHIGHLLAWAHQQELTIDEMLSMPFYHPVVEEGLRTALRDAAAQLQKH